MNKSYRSLWNAELGAWVAVSEITRARGKCSRAGAAMLAAVAMLAMSGASAQTLYWDTNGAAAGSGNAGGTWTAGTGTNWTGSAAGTTATTTWTNGAAADAVFAAGTDLTAARTITIAPGGVTARNLSFEDGTVTLSGGPLTLGAASTMSVSAGRTATLASAIGGTGTGITKTDTGTLVLSGANTYTGTTTVAGGTLRLSGGNAIADTGALVLANTAGVTLNLTTAETIGSLSGGGSTGGTVSLGAVLTTGADNTNTTFSGTISGGQQVVKTGTGNFTLNGTNTNTGQMTVNGGTLTLAGGSAIADTATVSLGNVAGATLVVNSDEAIGALIGGGTTGGAVVLNGATLTTSSAGNNTYAGAISGTGGVVKQGTGTWTLTGAGTWTGATAINAGAITVSGGNAIGDTSAVSIATTAATGLNLNNSSETIGSLAGGGAGIGGVALGTGTLTTGGNNGSTTYAGVITGTGGVTKTGSGLFTLTGSNTYTGTTTINGGTLRLGGGSGNVLSNSSAVTLADVAGATLDLNGNNETIASLAGGGSAGGNVTLGAGTLTTAGNASTTYAGQISGSGGVVKGGTGTLTLAGDNSYTGTTTVSGGTLQLGNGGTSGSVAGNIVNNATLAVNRSDAVTLGGNITGNGAFVQNGTGTTTLAGNNTIARTVGPAITVNNGQLIADGDTYSSSGSSTAVVLVQAAAGVTAGATLSNTAVTTTGTNGFGLQVAAGAANANSRGTVDGGSLRTTNAGSIGAGAQATAAGALATVIVTGGATVQTAGANAVGVRSFANTSSASAAFTMTGGSVTTGGAAAYGAQALASTAGASAAVTLNSVGTSTTGGNAFGVYAVTTGAAAANLVADRTSTVTLNGGSVSTTNAGNAGAYFVNSGGAHGLYASGAGAGIAADSLAVNANGAGAYAYNGATVTLSNSTVSSTALSNANSWLAGALAWSQNTQRAARLTVSNSSIASTRDYTRGVESYGNSEVTVTDSTVTTAGANAAGLTSWTYYLTQTPSEMVRPQLHSTNVTVSTTGNGAAAAYLGSGGQMDIRNSRLTTGVASNALTGTAAHGVDINGGVAFFDIRDSTIETHGNGSNGINQVNWSTITGSGATLTTHGDNAVGIWSGNYDSYGLNPTYLVRTTLDDVAISTSGTGSHGVLAFGSKYGASYPTDGFVDMRLGNASVTTTGDNAEGARVEGDRSTLTLSGAGGVRTSGASAHGLHATRSGVLNVTTANSFGLSATGAGSWAIKADNLGTVNIDGAQLVNVAGAPAPLQALADGGTVRMVNGAAGLQATFARNAGQVIFDTGTTVGPAVLTSNAGGTTVFRSTSDGGAASQVIVEAGGALDISGNTSGNVTVGSAEGAGDFKLGGSTLSTGALNTDRTITGVLSDGGISGGTGGSLNKIGTGVLTLTGANVHTGSTTVTAGTLRAGAVNTFSAASAHEVKAGATLDTAGLNQTVASLSNSGTVSLLSATPGSELVVKGAYVGQGGLLNLGTTLNAGTGPSDKLVIDGPTATASGNTRIQITNLGGLGALTTGNGIEVIAARNGGTTTAQTTADAFTLANGTGATASGLAKAAAGTGHVDAGAYEYRLFAADANGAGESWYLRSTIPAAEPAPAPAPTPDAPVATPILQPPPLPLYRQEVPLFAALPAQLRQADLAMLGNLHRRVGDEAAAPDSAAALAAGPRQAWGRLINSGIDLRQQGTVSAASSGHVKGFQAGTDLWADNGWRTGVYVGQLEGDVKVSGFARGYVGQVGRNDLRSRYIGAYATYASSDGFYADAVLQAGHHRYTVQPLVNAAAGGKGSSLLASIEVGQSFRLADGWTVEPQLQLIHQRLRLDDAQLVGATVRQSTDNGWIARAGVRVKGELATGLGTLQPYGRFNLYKASSGTDVARFIGPAGFSDIASRTGGTRAELAVGATLQLSPAWSAYGELGKLWATGGAQRTASSVQGSVGIKARW